MGKNLPIQLVKTRGDQDKFNKEGGSSETPPKWVTPEIVRNHSISMKEALSSFESLFEERESQLPILVVASINHEATAKSYRPNLRSVFRTPRKNNVIGIDSFAKLLVKIDNLADLQFIHHTIDNVINGHSTKDKPIGVAAVEELYIFTPTVDVDNLDGKTVKVRLVDYKSAELNSKASEIFKQNCQNAGIEIEQSHYSSNLIVYKAKNVSKDGLRALTTMDSVISVKEMPYYEISAAPCPWDVDIDVIEPVAGEDYPTLGILDSGVADVPHLSKWQVGSEHNIAGLNDDDIERNHGTMVASIALYGDKLENDEITGCGPVKYINCLVNAPSNLVAIMEDEMVMYIEEAIKSNPQVKVWNLSLGSSYEISDNCFSEFAIALDDIQQRYNVLICKSAGNSPKGNEKLAQGAESIRCLTVGSICNKGNHQNDLPDGTISPFSRIGFGPENIQKPEIVHYGGNVQTGVNVITAVGLTHSVKGTSFSTPRVSALASHLSHRIGGDFNATLIKALIVHNSYYPESVPAITRNVRRFYGFGKPSSISQMLYNDEDEFTMIWQPEFDVYHGSDYQILDFPYPSSLVDENGNCNGIITVTVVTNPILRSSEGNEYCQNDVEVKLGPIEEVIYVPIGAAGIPSTYRNEVRAKNPRNILVDSLYSKRKVAEDLKERTLILSNDKYQSVKKYQVDLSRLKPGVKAQIKDRNQWTLNIKGLTRDSAKEEVTTTGEPLTFSATIIITIKDPLGRHVAYDEGIRLLDQHNFEHSSVLVTNEITLNN